MTRNSSIELLRLYLMFIIVIGHCIIHGLGLYGVSPNSDTELLLKGNDVLPAMMVYGFCTCAVNCFVFISGYYGIRLTRIKFVALLFSLIFYQIIFNIIPSVIERCQSNLSNLLFLSNSPYWFIIDYLFLMVFAPLLNNLFSKMSKRYSIIVLSCLLIASCYFGFLWNHPVNTNGYTLFQFFLMYCLGRFVRLYNFNLKKSFVASSYIVISCCLGLLMYYCYLNDISKFVWRICYYNNPLVIINGICLFFIFKDVKFENNLINYFAKSALAIYLVQSSTWISKMMYGKIAEAYLNRDEMGGGIWLTISVLPFVVIILAITVDQLRLLLFKGFENRFLTKH